MRGRNTMSQSPASTSDVSGAPVRMLLTTTCGVGSASPFPILDRMWDIFSGKGIRTVFVSVGASASCMPDLEIAESLGCPINLVALSTAEQEQWAEVSSVLKERKRGEDAKFPFSAGAEGKWILPKNVRAQPALPWWVAGSVSLGGFDLKTQAVGDLMESICTTMKLKDNAKRIDILKLDTVQSAPGLERAVLGAILNAGYRPATILVNWSERPDVDLATTLAAGHLQNSGYRLMSKLDNKFLYLFMDSDVYQICSWEDINYMNPLVQEIVSSAVAQQKAATVSERVA
jgi:hypothetical protein